MRGVVIVAATSEGFNAKYVLYLKLVVVWLASWGNVLRSEGTSVHLVHLCAYRRCDAIPHTPQCDKMYECMKYNKT